MINLKERYIYTEKDRTRPLEYVAGTIWHIKARQDIVGCLSKCRGVSAKAKVNGKTIALSRVVWMFFNGEIPKGYQIDHINGDVADNRISNLKLVTAKENKQLGAKGLYKNNSSGATGVLWDAQNKKWKVSFRQDNKLYYFGLFDDLKDAKQKAKKERSKICLFSRRS